MRLIVRLSYLFLVYFFSLVLSAEAQVRVSSEFYSVNDGLSQNEVYDIAQDKLGFLWFATNDGLNCYDGYSFKTFKPNAKTLTNSFSNQLRRIHIDSRGYFWLLNDMGQVFLFNPNRASFKQFPNPETNKGDAYVSIKSIEEMPNGDVWLVGHGNGAVRIKYVGDSLCESHFCSKKQSQVGYDVRNVMADSDGIVWLLTDNGIATVAEADSVPSRYYLQENGLGACSLYNCVETTDEILICGGGGTLYRFDKYKRSFSTFSFGVGSDLNDICSVSDNSVFISSKKDGCFIFNHRSNSFRSYNKKNEPCLHGDEVDFLWKDARGDVWVKGVNSYGFARYSATLDKFFYMPFDFQDGVVPCCGMSFSFVDDNDVLWRIPSVGNEAWYDNVGEQPYFVNSKKKFPSVVFRTYEDTSGVFFSSTQYQGIRKCVKTNPSFLFAQNVKATDYTEENDVRAVMEDKEGRLWIATRDKRVRIYIGKDFVGCLSQSGSVVKNDVVFGDVSNIFQDKSGNIWIGRSSSVVKLVQNGAASFSLSEFSLEADGGVKPGRITDIIEDGKGRIWLTTSEDGLQLLDEKKSSGYLFVNRHNLLKWSYPPTLLQTNCIYEDKSGNIWVGSNEGITVFNNSFEDFRFLKFFFYNPENTNLVNSYVSDIFQDKSGKVWFASFGGGVFCLKGEFFLGETPEFVMLNKGNNTFPSDLIYSITEDASGVLWAVSESLIIKYDKESGQSESFGNINGLNRLGFSDRAFIKLRSGDFFVGTTSGFYFFDPAKVERSVGAPVIYFIRFLINNKEVEVGAEGSVLTDAMAVSSSIELNHDQNFISIEYSAIDYRNSSHIQYAYRLDGFDNDWNYVGSQKVASFTNLPHGEYKLRVKSTNVEGVWCNNERTVDIIIKPSFWQTGWAYLIYIMIFLIVVVGIVWAYMTNYRLRTQISFDKEMSSAKLQFFTDVSHELRTPLTLINAPLEKVLAGNTLCETDREQLKVVHSNAQRMLKMMNQILDFRKLQNNKMRLRVEQTEIGVMLARCCSNFEKLAETRNINFSFVDDTAGAMFWVDRDKFDTIMFNLLSNAFKFTPEGKRIIVTSAVEDCFCVIHVKDEGCGISKDKQSVIFDRYVTLQSPSLTRQSGTGIGLSLVKEIAELHHAEVSVESAVGVGSDFMLKIKPGTSHFDDNADIILDAGDEKQRQETENSFATGDEKVRILVVEDNDEMRAFIISVLSAKYIAIEAQNGVVGWNLVQETQPDFVVTDIMMPEMDGIELTRRIKENIQTSHIPVILLTAKTDMDSKLECLRIGANDYITKPFSLVYLETRIENILAERQKWQMAYKDKLIEKVSNVEADVPEEKGEVQPASAYDNAFMKKLIDFIEQNMENSDMSLDDVCDALRTTRWNMTSKVKSLVGMTPVEFIREMRLVRAAKLIDEGEYNMTQITYMIGMTDSRYFSRCFKNKYGVTPTEYKTRKS